MKKILSMVAVAAILATSSFALTAKYFVYSKQHKALGGMVGHSVVFVYKITKGNIANFKSKSELQIIKKIAHKKLCESKSRELITILNDNVIYIYTNKSMHQAIIININNCSGVPLSKKK